VAAGAIAAGEEINISYGALAGWAAGPARRRELREQYFFDCGCPACAAEVAAAAAVPAVRPKVAQGVTVVLIENYSNDSKTTV
jgi:hypothetical protein